MEQIGVQLHGLPDSFLRWGGLIILSIVISGIYPALVQQISVKPNAQVKEKPFISRNIEATREAYGIGTQTSTQTGMVNYVDYPGTPSIDASELTSAANSALERDITVSAFAITKTSAPVSGASSASRTAWAPSRASM